MKRVSSVFIASVIAVLISTGCSGGNNENADTAANDVTVSTSETSMTETEAETEVQSESETETETEMQTETEMASQTETEAQTEEITFLSAEEDDSAAEYGNDITGYIYLPAGWEYSENEAGEFTIVSPDGLSRAESLLFTGFAGGSESSENTVLVNGGYITVSATGQTAMMFCETVVLNSEVEGYNVYDIFEIQCVDISGFRAVMLDTDTDLGFRYYAAFPDEESGNIYAVKIESSDCTVENMSALGAAVDGYHRVSSR